MRRPRTTPEGGGSKGQPSPRCSAVGPKALPIAIIGLGRCWREARGNLALGEKNRIEKGRKGWLDGDEGSSYTNALPETTVPE